jgi:LPS sulfotransferase NodH
MSYLLCGTPRTGSTLLCSLLASTDVAGRPESYFREPDKGMWAERFGLSVGDDGAVDPAAFVAGAVRRGSTANGVFAARVMWGSLDPLVAGLDRHGSKRSDLEVLEAALGPLRFVHLRRRDVRSQAVSWARAEQSGYWQQGDEVRAEPRLDLDQIDDLLRTIDEHEAAWRAWFSAEGVDPLEVDYESVVSDPAGTVRSILGWIHVRPPADWVPRPAHRRQADGTNADWVRSHRQARA